MGLMEKIKIGITGQAGFIGTHLFNYLGLKPDVELITFKKHFFDNPDELEAFVKQCNAIVHLAAMNRHDDQQVIYNTNVSLVNKIITACRATGSTPHILFSSSTQEEKDNLYGQSKLAGRLAFETWAKSNKALVTGLIVPNVFGPFGKPNYNSFIATFCYKLNNNEIPVINIDAEVGLIYVNELIKEIYDLILLPDGKPGRQDGVLRYEVPSYHNVKVSAVLNTLLRFKKEYLEEGAFPDLTDEFEKCLFNTFRCYVPEEYYPHPFKLNIDNRGMFVEIARTNTPGQTSFSTTVPGITRGNHFHTRKAERFAVIKGKAKIQLRKIGTTDVINYDLDGEKPSYVDMPIWYTHNITNVGTDELVTIFWINEPFDAADSDTYFENV
jgi:UDP-2-acetamido-2,6-beta-L-arabino-hexul-4-ose reductase